MKAFRSSSQSDLGCAVGSGACHTCASEGAGGEPVKRCMLPSALSCRSALLLDSRPSARAQRNHLCSPLPLPPSLSNHKTNSMPDRPRREHPMHGLRLRLRRRLGRRLWQRPRLRGESERPAFKPPLWHACCPRQGCLHSKPLTHMLLPLMPLYRLQHKQYGCQLAPPTQDVQNITLMLAGPVADCEVRGRVCCGWSLLIVFQRDNPPHCHHASHFKHPAPNPHLEQTNKQHARASSRPLATASSSRRPPRPTPTASRPTTPPSRRSSRSRPAAATRCCVPTSSIGASCPHNPAPRSSRRRSRR